MSKKMNYWLRLFFLKPLWPFKQMRLRGSWYTCPYLMHFQWLVWRLWKRNLYWSEGGYLCETLSPSGAGAQVRCWWPDWLVILECCWHNRSWWNMKSWWRDRHWRRDERRRCRAS